MRHELLLFLIFPILSFGFTSDTLIRHADVESVNLEKDSVFTVCPWNRYSCLKDEARTKVSSFVNNSGKNNLTYYYTPSGGRIVGQGANVVWDLSDTLPGKYSLTVGVGNDGIIRGKTVTKTLIVSECPECDRSCYCPSLSVLGPKGTVKAGDAFIVHANVQGDNKTRITYHWTTSAGSIVDGQNTNQILIRTTRENAVSPIEIKVEIGGTDPGCSCPTEASDSLKVIR